MSRNPFEKYSMLVKNILLPLTCIYLFFAVPASIYERNQQSFCEFQEQPVEEKECCESCDEVEALTQPLLIFSCLRPDSNDLHILSGVYISDDFTKGVHQPPEATA